MNSVSQALPSHKLVENKSNFYNVQVASKRTRKKPSWLIPMPDNEAKPMTRPASQVKPAQVPVPESGLPISKIEQHALATQLIALWPDDETVETQILVPILDRTTQQVLMHSLLENKVTGAPIGISAGLLQCIQEEGSEVGRFFPLQRTPDTRFWLDTISWVHHDRGQLILTEQECADLVKGEVLLEIHPESNCPSITITRSDEHATSIRPRF